MLYVEKLVVGSAQWFSGQTFDHPVCTALLHPPLCLSILNFLPSLILTPVLECVISGA